MQYVVNLSNLWQPTAKPTVEEGMGLLVVCDRQGAAACSAARQLQISLQTFLDHEGWTIVISSASEDNVLAVRHDLGTSNTTTAPTLPSPVRPSLAMSMSLAQELQEAQAVVLLQTPGVLERASPLFILYEAITQRLPVICCALKGAQYDFGHQKLLLGSLAHSLSGAHFQSLRRMLLERDVTLPRLQGVLQRTIPSIISLSYDVHASEAKGNAFMETLAERLNHEVVQQGHHGLAMCQGHMREVKLLKRSMSSFNAAVKDGDLSRERAEQLAKSSVGTRIRHRTKGIGTITEKMLDGRVRIAFDDGGEHRYKKSSFHKIRVLGKPAEVSKSVSAKVLDFRRRASMPPPGSPKADESDFLRAEKTVDPAAIRNNQAQAAILRLQGQAAFPRDEQQSLKDSLGIMTTSEAV